MKTNTENTAQHTPGPWVNRQSDHETPLGLIWITQAGQGNVPLIARASEGNPQAEANARLISASPELLEALKELAFTVETIAHLQGLERDLLPMADKARAAIAKATGGVK